MNKKEILIVLFLGSLWGLSEVFLGKALYGTEFAYSSVILSLVALGILGISYSYMDRMGIPTLIALVAIGFRVVNAGPFYCHLLGIFMLGAGFDITTYLLRERKYSFLTGPVSAWLGYALFAFAITYVFRYHYWTAVGLPKVLRHIGINGSLAASGSILTVYLGYKAGDKVESLFKLKPKIAYASFISITVLIWLGGLI